MDIDGLDLAERFFHDAVEPVVARACPGLRYAAALIGPGSEVLGYDTATSRDHDWGPRSVLFLAESDWVALATGLTETLDRELPDASRGYPVRFAVSDPGAGIGLVPREAAPSHRVQITSVEQWSQRHLGVAAPLELGADQWLTIPQQRLLEITAGRVFRDDDGRLTAVRSAFTWYPGDVWRYLLACQWQRVAQLEPFVGRAGDVGDDLGSRLIGAALIRDAMRLAFLVERRYAPYAKWSGTAFQRLALAMQLSPLLTNAAGAAQWRERELALNQSFEVLGHATNSLVLADPVDPSPRPFYDRPYRVMEAHRYRDALDRRITDANVRGIIARNGWIGAVDQFSDSVDLLTSAGRIQSVIRCRDDSGPSTEWVR